MSFKSVSVLILSFAVMAGCAAEKPVEPSKPMPPAQKKEEMKGNMAMPAEPA